MLWVHNLNWDDVLPNDLLKEWRNFAKQLLEMPLINISRSFHFYIALTIELVGYYYTSSVAYGGGIYFKSVFSDKINISFVCSKS